MMWNRKGTGRKSKEHTRDILFSNIICVPDMYKEFRICIMLANIFITSGHATSKQARASLVGAKQNEARRAEESRNSWIKIYIGKFDREWPKYVGAETKSSQ